MGIRPEAHSYVLAARAAPRVRTRAARGAIVAGRDQWGEVAPVALGWPRVRLAEAEGGGGGTEAALALRVPDGVRDRLPLCEAEHAERLEQREEAQPAERMESRTDRDGRRRLRARLELRLQLREIRLIARERGGGGGGVVGRARGGTWLVPAALG